MTDQGKQIGNRSIAFNESPYIIGTSSVAGEKEGEGAFGKYYDMVETDPMFGAKSWEEAESKMQHIAADIAIKKAGLETTDIRYLIAGDLLGQLIATSFGIMNLNIPMFGVYGACSTMGESMAIASMLIDGGYADYIIALTSSHFASAEKEFRFPLAYGNQRPFSASWTVTGSGAVVIASSKAKWVRKETSYVRITGITTGTITDYGIKDSMNMGACMAPAACDAILSNFKDFGIGPDDYDKIITGDLGVIGQQILAEMMKGFGYDITEKQMDCGTEIYHRDSQDTNVGGSGCGCCAITLCGYILNKMRDGNWKRVLFVPTGALLSKVSFHQGNSIPGIAHAVMLQTET
jgi:stage V sporulation protein AD